jgi:hypothetical protein
MVADSASVSSGCGFAGGFFFTGSSMVRVGRTYAISAAKPVRNHPAAAVFFLQVPRKESKMAKSGISIGDDTPSGEPQNGPRGPYIDDETDDTTAVARRAGQDPTRTRPGGSRTETKIAQESEIGSDGASSESEIGAAASGSRSSRQDASKLTPDLPDELAKRPKGPAQP